MQDQKKLQNIKIVNSSAYATHKHYNITEWLRVKKIFRNRPTETSSLTEFERLSTSDDGIRL